MTFFDIDGDTMIDLERIDYVRFQELEEQKVVVVGIGGQSFIIPITKHKDFFEQITRLGAIPTKQFVSL